MRTTRRGFLGVAGAGVVALALPWSAEPAPRAPTHRPVAAGSGFADDLDLGLRSIVADVERLVNAIESLPSPWPASIVGARYVPRRRRRRPRRRTA